MYVTKVFTHNAEIEWHTDQVARVTPQNIFHVFNGFNIHSIISCPWLWCLYGHPAVDTQSQQELKGYD